MALLTILFGLGLGIGLLLLGLEIVFALGIGSIAMLFLLEGSGSLRALGFIVWGSLNSQTLSALPLFILMAEFLVRSGVSQTFYTGMSRLVNWLPGRLLQTNIAGSAMFAAISGSSVATAAAIGSVAIPRQEKDGYDVAMSCGSVAAGGVLGILIPPSIVMIIYSTFSEVSVVRLFTAGIIPGVMLTVLFMIYIGVRATMNPSLAPAPKNAEKQTFRTTLRGIWEITPVLTLMFFVLGSIYSGLATPTEAAGVGAFGAGLVAWFVGKPGVKVMGQAIMNALVVSASLLSIALSAFIFAYAVEKTGVARSFSEFVVAMDLNVYLFLFMLMIFYFLLGCIIDSIAMILLTVPLLLPILAAYEIDMIWFGVVLVVVVELGQITPPVGINLYVVDSIAKTGIGTVVRGTAPYFAIIGVFIIILTIFPGIATWLPSIL